MKIIQYDNTNENNYHLLKKTRMNFRIIIHDDLYRYNTQKNDLEYVGTLFDYDTKEIKEIKNDWFR